MSRGFARTSNIRVNDHHSATTAGSTTTTAPQPPPPPPQAATATTMSTKEPETLMRLGLLVCFSFFFPTLLTISHK